MIFWAGAERMVGAGESGFVSGEESFCFEGGHTASSGGGYGLSENEILNIASGKYAGHAGLGCSGLRFHILIFVQFKLALDQSRIGRVSDCGEHGAHVQGRDFTGLEIFDLQACDFPFGWVQDIDDDMAVKHAYFGVIEQAFLHGLACETRLFGG